MDEKEQAFLLRLIASALNGCLTILLAKELFPEKRFYQLSEDEKRILLNEVRNLTLFSRWQFLSEPARDYFETQPPGIAPPRPKPPSEAEGPPSAYI
ncbi:MAG: hypothetical protein ACK4Z6_08130 [Candidatus Methylomirabilales bacterium]